MKLVEVVRAELTSDVAVDTAVAFVQRIGKLPVVVRDHPGFLVNRILLPYLLEAVRLFKAGAEVRALDESMLDFGMPMGPLRLLDEVGLDVASDVAQTLCAAFPERMQMPGFFPNCSRRTSRDARLARDSTNTETVVLSVSIASCWDFGRQKTRRVSPENSFDSAWFS